jgi:hypothetical protein
MRSNNQLFLALIKTGTTVAPLRRMRAAMWGTQSGSVTALVARW